MIILFFWERTCPNCDRAYRAIVEVISDVGENLRVLTYNVDRDEEMARRYNVVGTPTTVFIERGKKPISVLGVLTTEGLKGYIKRFRDGPSPISEEEKKIDIISRR